MGKSKTILFTETQNQLAQTAKALAHPARIAILQLLSRKQSCFCGDIVEELPLSQSTVSQHLKALKEAGLIKGDIEGPIQLAWAVSKRQMEMDEPIGFRLLVMGNSRFLGPIQPYGVMKGNMDFFLNALSWVNEREETITVRSKSLFRLPLRMDALIMYIYAGIIVILIPLGILITGLVIWLRRRHL